MPSPRPAACSEARDAVERFRALTERAIEACAQGDEAQLSAALGERELVDRRVRHLMGVGAAGRRDAGSAAAGEAELRRALAESLRLNARLEESVAAMRDELQRQLRQLDHDRAAVGGYASSMPRARRLDLRR